MPTEDDQTFGQQNLMHTFEAIPRTDLLPPDMPVELVENRKVTFSKLINMVSYRYGLTKADTTIEDLERARPMNIDRGLYIPKEDKERTEQAEHLYQEVVFPSPQFGLITRSPRGLANRAYAKTQAANDRKPADQKQTDRDIVHATASRAAGHALEKRADDLEELRNGISAELIALRALRREIGSGGRAHYRAENLDKLRQRGHTSIHQAVEAAAINLGWDNQLVDGVQQAVNYNLYGYHGHNNQRIKNWRQYTWMAGNYAKARIKAMAVSQRATSVVLKRYQPFLDEADQE
ncbi:MAG TPA: hypothetical protein VLF39_03150 [Candidatus Saccharimonadales bacterium]|nr:hypothetical protein [Candidatus Saccharimonadales bacterium]